MKPPRLAAFRTEDDTATRIGYTLDDAYAAITVFDTSDPKTVADQLRALADRIDPSTEREIRTTPKKRRHRTSGLLP
jgi:hypothetical protein